MNTTPIQPQRALISVSNKDGIIEFARGLKENGVEIISTGGTSAALKDAGIDVIDIADFTGFPEIMDGRVKTLHPKVHGGILGRRQEHAAVAAKNGINWIDIVVVNLYPFAQTIQNPNATEEEIIENIDIGGPTMIRSAAKNFGYVAVAVDPADYGAILNEIKSGGISYATRKKLSHKAFGHTAEYDAVIHNHFTKKEGVSGKKYQKRVELRYGENPHQKAIAYALQNYAEPSILNAKIHQGKQLSYNNIADADAALATLKEFGNPACVVVKHANPCGVCTGEDMIKVFQKAYDADSLSAFGGIIALNRTCTKEIAEKITQVFAEIVMAPDYENSALKEFAKKPKLRVLELGKITPLKPAWEYKYIQGGLLAQDTDIKQITQSDLQVVAKNYPSPEEIRDCLFAWRVLKHVKSNAILIAKDSATVGIGAGQVSRVDAVDIAIKKSGVNIDNSVLASDAFFPFRDSIDRIAQTGVTAIIQPGGSIKDKEVIKACDEHNISMMFTGARCFKH